MIKNLFAILSMVFLLKNSNCEKLSSTCFFLCSCIHHFQANSLNSLIHNRHFPEKLTLGTFSLFISIIPDFENISKDAVI